MAVIPNLILESLNNYISLLEKNKLRIESAYLFGSYAKGLQKEFSDIDIALISPDFCGKRFLDIDKIRKFKFMINDRISPLPYRPEDFNESDFFVKEILSSSIKLR